MGAPYATVSDMTARYGKTYLQNVLDATISGTSPDETCAELLEILNDVSDEIETYCRAAGYQVPLSSTPGVIKNACRQMAHYYCYDYTEGRTPPSNIKDQYDRWIDWLKGLAKGKVKLDVSTEPTRDDNEDVAETLLTYEDADWTEGKGDTGTDYDTFGNFRVGPQNTSDS